MKKIICRKCGSEIDASLGECPVCGAVYYILSDDSEREPPSGSQPKAPDTSGSEGAHTWTIDDILNESTAEFGLDTSAYGQTSRQDAGQSGYTAPGNYSPAQGNQYTGQNGQYTQQNNQYTQPNAQYGRQDSQYTQRSPQQRDNNQYTQQNGQNPQYTQSPRGNRQNAQYGQQNRNPQQRDDRYSRQGNQRQNPRYANQSNQNGQRPRRQGGQNPQRPQQNSRQGQRPGQNMQQRSRRELMDDDTAYYGQERGGGMSNRTKMLIVGAAAALALLTVIIFIMSGVFSFGKDEETQYMPDLEGLTVTSAKNILESYDLNLKISTTYEDSSEEKDIVISQSVKKGKKLARKDSIVLVLSNGRGEEEPEESDKPTDEPEDEKIPVPDLSGKTFQEAERELDRLGLKISRTAGVYDDNVPEGSIVSQSPVKGGELKKGGTVIVTLSNGPQPTEAPKNHIITVTAGKGGSISPKGQVEVKDGGSQSFSITPDSGYEIREVKVDGTNVGAVDSYTFTNVTGDHSIYAVFQTAATPSPTPTPTPTPPPPTDPPPPTEPVGAPDNPAND